jgi:hypothetical protein
MLFLGGCYLLLFHAALFMLMGRGVVCQEEYGESGDKPYVKVIDANYADGQAGQAGEDGLDYGETRLSAAAPQSQLVPPYMETPLDYRRVCIYPNWSILRESNMAKIFPEDIDPNLCTHIHYAYANIDVKTLQLSPSQYQDFNSGDHGAVCGIFLFFFGKLFIKFGLIFLFFVLS